MKPIAQTTLRVDADLYQQIEHAALARRESINKLIVNAIIVGLKHLPMRPHTVAESRNSLEKEWPSLPATQPGVVNLDPQSAVACMQHSPVSRHITEIIKKREP